MKFDGLAQSLHKRQDRLRMLPGEFERSAQDEVFKGLPRSVSVRMTRGPAGVQVALTGRGAAEAAQSVRERLRAAGKASVGVVWRESDV